MRRCKPVERVYIRLALCLALLPASTASGQIFGEAARTEFFGGLGIRTFYSHVEKTDLYIDGEKTPSIDAPQVRLSMVPVALVYGAAPGISLIAVLPTISRAFEGRVNGERNTVRHTGLGDITLFAKYRFFKKDSFLRSRQAALQAGVKLPTGRDDLTDDEGLRLPPPLQLGSGALDYRLIAIFTESVHRWVFSADAGLTIRTEANRFMAGHTFNYDVAAKFRLRPRAYSDVYPTHDLFAFIEVNGAESGMAESAGSKVPDSGGHQLFVAPGIQYFPLENLIVEAGLQIPVVQHLNGTQLGTNRHLRVGLRWILIP